MNNNWRVFVVTFAAVLAAGAVMAERHEYERYQPIVDRMPFGTPASAGARGGRGGVGPGGVMLGPDGQPILTPEQETLQKAVFFTLLNVDFDGTVKVAFTDYSDANAEKRYYLNDGESQDGWTVKAVDLEERTMTVEKDGIEVVAKLGERPAGAPSGKGGGAKGAKKPGMLSANKPGRSGLLSRPGEASSAPGEPSTRLTRRAKREANERASAEQKAAEEAERKQREEEKAAQEAEEKARREQERAEQREQLKSIQEELRRTREEKAAHEAAGESDNDEE